MTRQTDPESPESPASRGESAGQAGFTVLEAIVAVAILGLAMIPLLSLQVQTSQGAIALERTVDRRIARDVGLAYLRLVDPVANPEGQLSIGGGWTLAWTAETLTPERVAINGWTNPSRHAVTRYRMRGSVTHESGRTMDVLAVTPGIRETRSFESVLIPQ